MNELCQHKPTHGSDFFDEAGRRTLAAWPSEIEPSLIERIAEMLAQHGVAPGTATQAAQGAVDLLESAANELAIEQTGRMLAEFVLRLEGTTAGEALRRVILGVDEPIRAQAARAGCSHTALLKQVKRICVRLGVSKAPVGV